MHTFLRCETDEGISLPVIDVTHPSFAVTMTEAEIASLSDQFVHESTQRQELPPAVLEALERSMLGRALMAASGTFLTGMNTYVLKLGPANLGADASPIDRAIAASFPAVMARVRLHDMARLLADGVTAALAATPRRPLSFVNIGGGPAADSWNALIHLHAERPDPLADRPISINVLDIDDHGPAFGTRAIHALCAPGAPLSGLQIGITHMPYQWSDAGRLRSALDDLRVVETMCAISSEGALFEYGSDIEIISNLETLQAGTARDAIVVGSVTRDGEPTRSLPTSDRAATRPRTLAAFRSLAEQAGWIVQCGIERPFSYNVRLVKT